MQQGEKALRLRSKNLGKEVWAVQLNGFLFARYNRMQ